jgi:hypothetical protein
VTVKLADMLPTGTATVEFTVAAALLLARPTRIPPVGAALLSVTVPVDEMPPSKEVGLTVRLETVGAFTVRVAV